MNTGLRYDTAPLGLGKNWVTEGGGLDPFHRAVAHALLRSGHTEAEAVQIALGAMKRWAAGGGDVTAKTRAKAARAVARWEQLRAQAHATPNKRSSGLVTIDAALAAAGFRGDRPGHAFHGNQWTHDLGEIFHAGRPDTLAGAIRAVKATGHARILGAGPVERRAADGVRERLRREGVTATVHPVTAQGRHYLRVVDTRRRSMTRTAPGLETESGTAGLLLPKGPLAHAIPRHRFQPDPNDSEHCSLCRQGRDAAIHTDARKERGVAAVTAALHTAGFRHAGHDHHAVPTGHLTAARRQQLAQIHRQADNLEPSMREAMANLFTQQAKATLDRLKGRRGQQMLRAAQPPDEPPPADGEPAPLVDAAQVYDMAHWTAKTAETLKPMFGAVVSLTADRFATQLGEHETQTSLSAVRDVLDQRLARLAQSVSQTTFDEVARVLRDGVANGQTVGQMTAALEGVFGEAERNRAATIARTESLGSLNEAAATYADRLPGDVMAAREWLSAHDTRVRPTHRAADGQIRPMGVPYIVGGVPMLFPHDPAAPPEETVNCRCTQAFLTPAEYARRTQPASVAA